MRKHKEQVQRRQLDGGYVSVDEMVSNSNNEDTDMEEIIGKPFQRPPSRRNVGGKKETFRSFPVRRLDVESQSNARRSVKVQFGTHGQYL